MCEEERIFSKIFNMFVWTSGFQKSLAHTDFNMFVYEWTSANESPSFNDKKVRPHFYNVTMIERFDRNQ